MWNLCEILSMMRAGLEREDRLLRAEHAVRGIDASRESDMHLLLSQSLREIYPVVLREAYFPSTQRDLPRDSHRDRCDLVILPEGKESLYDPVVAHKEVRKASGTLFEPVAQLPTPTLSECAPGDALWLEVKAVPQHRYVEGVPVPNSRYAHELVSGPARDIVKLSADPLIRSAAVLVVLFNELEDAGGHDLAVALRELIDRDLPVGMPEVETFPIEDRCGNAFCTLGLIPLRL